MITTGVSHLVNHTRALVDLNRHLTARRDQDRLIKHSDGGFTEDDAAGFNRVLNAIEPWLKTLALDASQARLTRLRGALAPINEEHNEYGQSDDVIKQIDIFLETLEDELSNRVFLSLSSTELTSYKEPNKAFPKTVKSFPSSAWDIIGASRCYAVGEGTACVFHCMGILQSGLYALAKDLNVQFAYPLELENWKAIIDKIETEIKAKEKEAKSLKKDINLKFYSQAAIQFRYFKDAWRNHVCHMRAHYDIHEAQSILTHVTDFMETIAERLREVPDA